MEISGQGQQFAIDLAFGSRLSPLLYLARVAASTVFNNDQPER
jgi:hypothetical protein